MPDHGRRRSPYRLLAPLALVLVTGAVAVVVANSDIADGDDGETSATTTERTTTEPTTTTGRDRRQRRNYVVRPGDSFGSIAEKTGVSVEQLELLNPEVDPQALVVGQRIKLRE
jgi:teichoic acid transport system ATP-binding protein